MSFMDNDHVHPAPPRRLYSPPRLDELGTARDLTQTGGTGNGPDGPNYPTETS